MSRRRNKRQFSRAEAPNTPHVFTPSPNRGQRVVQHIDTFVAGINQWSSKLYINPDEAYRNSRSQQSAMRRDPVIMQPLRQRQLGTALLEWQIVPEDSNNRQQKEVCKELTKICQNIPYFLKLRMALLEAVWFGRYAAELDYAWHDEDCEELGINSWIPHHGDKLAFEHETGNVGIYVRNYQMGGDNRFSYESKVHMLSESERSRLVIHKHEIEDGEYWEPESAGMIHGVGLRTRVYWPWWIKQTSSQWLMDFLERAALGITLWFYEAGNPVDEQKTREAAEKFTGDNVIIVPAYIGTERMFERVKRIEPSTGGAQMFKEVIDEYLGKQIRGMIVGQEATSQMVNAGLGSEIAKIQQDVFMQIVEFDAINLGETLTSEMLDILVKWNYGKLPFKPKFELVIQEQDPKVLLDAAQIFQAMGGKVSERQVREIIGLNEPEPGDRILGQAVVPAGTTLATTSKANPQQAEAAKETLFEGADTETPYETLFDTEADKETLFGKSAVETLFGAA